MAANLFARRVAGLTIVVSPRKAFPDSFVNGHKASITRALIGPLVFNTHDTVAADIPAWRATSCKLILVLRISTVVFGLKAAGLMRNWGWCFERKAMFFETLQVNHTPKRVLVNPKRRAHSQVKYCHENSSVPT